MYTFGDWWQHLSGWQQFFWTGAIIGSVLLLIRAILSLVDTEPDEAPPLWTAANALIFLTFFCWMGIILLNLASPLWLALTAATFTGLLIVGIAHYVLATEPPSFLKQDVVNHTAKVQIDIPPHRIGHGRIEIEVRGALLELDAVTIGNELPTGFPVRVVDVVDRRTLLVEPAPIEPNSPILLK